MASLRAASAVVNEMDKTRYPTSVLLQNALLLSLFCISHSALSALAPRHGAFYSLLLVPQSGKNPRRRPRLLLKTAA